MFVVATGTYLPPSRPNTDHAGAAGSPDNEWPTRCVAGPEDHPASMSALALRAALASARIDAGELALVAYTGRARDYLPSWSVATEVMKLVGAPPSCVGLDLSLGCAALPAALELARGWLEVPRRRYAAVIDAERSTGAIDRVDPTSARLWGHGDGAAALIASDEPSRSGASLEYVGAAFASHATYNDLLMPPHGGTRSPRAERGEQQLVLRLDATPAADVFGIHSRLYERAWEELRARTGVSAIDHVICSQLSPAWVERTVARFHRPRPKSVVNTGRIAGHVGGADLILGLDAVLRSGPGTCSVLAAGTAPFATALALFRA